MNHEEKVLLIWQCDKKDCGSINRRWVDLDVQIFDDVCDVCTKHIHEPITELITATRESEE